MKPPPRRVLLYTDAGVRMMDQLATWGAVVVLPEPGTVPWEASGRLRDATLDTTAAELRAMANGLHRAIAAGVIIRGDHVTLVCDNTFAVGLVKRSVKPRLHRAGLRQREALTALDKLARRACLHALTARGVKGHQPETSTDPHAVHNRRCDQLCHEARG